MGSHPINLNDRQKHLKQRSLVIWFTGLSGSGKTTLSDALEQELYQRGYKTYILDGDKIRNGLCKDLGFSEYDRAENIRRVGEVANLMMDAGLIVLSAFISPFEADRNLVREMIGADNLVRVFVDCPIEVCEQRDVKGLYKKARSGEIKSFTGISSPFEIPEESELILKTAENSKEELVGMILEFILPKINFISE
ncbi:adenylylsulfate kinase [Daejeonella rubra]|uniref:Adenylyl-sulfate kinase n=1 Tax=Daejeonella rubra TaxID=990371 RepID=A0A1G9XW98_9SPHI|nr:adenylyl-sulfate kinase [Daejeonella rubra]SDN01078.1 adenylylsulfate kinase [Daejeonella rubra]